MSDSRRSASLVCARVREAPGLPLAFALAIGSIEIRSKQMIRRNLILSFWAPAEYRCDKSKGSGRKKRSLRHENRAGTSFAEKWLASPSPRLATHNSPPVHWWAVKNIKVKSVKPTTEKFGWLAAAISAVRFYGL